MAQFFGNQDNAGGRMSAAGHKIRGRGYHLAEKRSSFLAGRASGVSLVAAGSGEPVLSGAVMEELELYPG